MGEGRVLEVLGPSTGGIRPTSRRCGPAWSSAAGRSSWRRQRVARWRSPFPGGLDPVGLARSVRWLPRAAGGVRPRARPRPQGRVDGHAGSGPAVGAHRAQRRAPGPGRRDGAVAPPAGAPPPAARRRGDRHVGPARLRARRPGAARTSARDPARGSAAPATRPAAEVRRGSASPMARRSSSAWGGSTPRRVGRSCSTPSPAPTSTAGAGRDRRGGTAGGDLRARLAALDLEGVVSLVGARPDAVDLLAAADVVVVSSCWESGPLVLSEAMPLGRPVVTTPVGVAAALVDDGISGRLVPVGDATAIAVALTEVLSDPGARRGWGRPAGRVAAGATATALSAGSPPSTPRSCGAREASVPRLLPARRRARPRRPVTSGAGGAGAATPTASAVLIPVRLLPVDPTWDRVPGTRTRRTCSALLEQGAVASMSLRTIAAPRTVDRQRGTSRSAPGNRAGVEDAIAGLALPPPAADQGDVVVQVFERRCGCSSQGVSVLPAPGMPRINPAERRLPLRRPGRGDGGGTGGAGDQLGRRRQRGRLRGGTDRAPPRSARRQ